MYLYVSNCIFIFQHHCLPMTSPYTPFIEWLLQAPTGLLRSFAVSDAMSISQRTTKINLHAGQSDSKGYLSFVAKQVKNGFRTLANYHHTKQWLSYWNTSPQHMQLARATPRLMQKIYRPYQSIRLSIQDRFALLTSHYNFVLQHGLGSLTLRAANNPVLLVSFNGKSDTAYEIYLSAMATLDREGELVLELCSNQQLLFSIAFTFCNKELQPCVRVGCLQGPRGDDKQERVRAATRDMFGLRPKNLVLRLVREIAQEFGCKNLILVSNGHRVMQYTRKDKLFANYDEFWLEAGAIRRSDGDFQLACDHIPVTNLEEIPSSKRSEARKRMALVANAAAATRGYLSNYHRPS